MRKSNVQVTELGGSTTFDICKIVADRKRVIRKVSLIFSATTGVSTAIALWTLNLYNYTTSANMAARVTYVAAADDSVAATEYELVVSDFDAEEGDVLGLKATITGAATDLSAVSVTLKIDWM